MQIRYTTLATRLSTMALLGSSALAATACSSGTPVGAAPSAAITASAAAPGATPIAVNCGPGQQALIRPSLIAGQTISQVECVPIAGMPAAVAAYGMAAPVPAAYYAAPVEQPVVYRAAQRPVSYRRPLGSLSPEDRRVAQAWGVTVGLIAPESD